MIGHICDLNDDARTCCGIASDSETYPWHVTLQITCLACLHEAARKFDARALLMRDRLDDLRWHEIVDEMRKAYEKEGAK